MTASLGLALWYATRNSSQDENSYVGKPRLEKSRIVHVRNSRFLASPVGAILGLVDEGLRHTEPSFEEPELNELRLEEPDLETPDLETPDLEEPSLVELEPQDSDFETPSLQKLNFLNLSLERISQATTAPRFFTVFDAGDQERISALWMSQQITAFQACDTFQKAFLNRIVFTTSVASTPSIGEGVRNILKKAGVKWISWLSTSRDWHSSINPGPYYIACDLLYELRRLHDDTHHCFVTSIIQPSPKQPFETITYPSSSCPSVSTVALPSRLQNYNANPHGLAGMRVAVKDNFNIDGIKTSLCNNAYNSFYPAAKSTAVCIQKLLDRGAVVIGKTKLSSFAATEEPIQCIDWPAPWNPRADKYQSPAGSSSGSAAAIAAYEWLDVAIGSDTSGSGRRPGHWNGVVAMRPTHGVLNTDGLVPSFERFDVPAFFGRDLVMCRRFAEAWYGDALPNVRSELPVEIILPVDYLETIGNPDQLQLIEVFTHDMEKFFGVKAQMICLESLWAEDPPEEAERRRLSDYMEPACRNSFWYDDFHNQDDFRRGYEAKFRKTPYVSPPVRKQWGIASKITREERDDAVSKLSVYREWFASKVMRIGERNTIVVLPIEEISPRYRDENPCRDFYPKGVPMLFLSPILGGPELTIPIGKVSYDSMVTGRREYLPVGISLMASPGYDLVLMDLTLQCLKHANRSTRVQPGRHIFPSS